MARTTRGAGRTTARPLALPRQSSTPRRDGRGSWVMGLPGAKGSSGCGAGSLAGLKLQCWRREAGGNARTGDLQVPTGSLPWVRGGGPLCQAGLALQS